MRKRKIIYEKENKNINNKYCKINNEEKRYYSNKKELLIKNNQEKITKLPFDKEIEKINNIKQLNKIIYNTYNIIKDNYFLSLNLNNIILNYKNQESEKEKDWNDNEIKYEKKEEITIEKKSNNYIIGEIIIKENDQFEKIRIINSYDTIENYSEEQENEFKDNCEIYINNQKIEFSNFHIFKEIGKYTIKYCFLNDLTMTNFMFADCHFLTSLDLSNFDTQNVTDMNSMFYGCNSLTNLNLSNFNTQNVTNMNSMFYGCSSLTNLNLSSFNTQNVIDMNSMFYGCYALINLDLSNFNTQKVSKMNSMFYECHSLTNLNLTNFITQNVIDMSKMFYNCYSLTKLNLENFNTQNVNDISDIFVGCESLDNKNLICEDEKILGEFGIDDNDDNDDNESNDYDE